MPPGSFRFERFLLDPGDRRLSCGGERVELNARYFDALLLLVSERGRLVSKQRFLDQVWRGIPVTDEALTQCIKTLRQRLGDDVTRPRFIETVPKHGYRFVADVECDEGHSTAAHAAHSRAWRELMSVALFGTLGGGVAGILGGLVYGFAAASGTVQPQVGAISLLIVVLCFAMVVAFIGAAGVCFGMALAALLSGSSGASLAAGGALGGLVVGAVVKLLGVDAFTLLIGWSPGEITGPWEGLILGAGVGLGAWSVECLGAEASIRSRILAAGAVGGTSGLLIALGGGHLLGGSLQSLAQHSPASRLRLDSLGLLFGEKGLGPVTQAVTSALEGMLFAACIVGGMLLTRAWPRRALEDNRQIRSATAGTTRA